MEFISQPWPWYVAGPLIALTMFTLLYWGKSFGMSSNLRTLCAMGGAGKFADFFKFDWKAQQWNLMVVLGTVIGGYIGQFVLTNPEPIALNTETISDLATYGFQNAGATVLPPELFSWESALSLKGFSILAIGGLLVGFGTRYGGGCTSGHAITGLSSLQLPSLIATISFFVGGLVMVHFLFPLIF